MKTKLIFIAFCFLLLNGCFRNKSSMKIHQPKDYNDFFINLIDKDVDELKDDNDIIFHMIKNNDIHAIRKLINKGFDVNMISSDNRFTPLIYSIQKERNDIVLFLLENDVNLELCTTWGSPLAISAGRNNFYLVKLLLNKGADINNNNRFPDNFSKYRSAIFCAACNYNFEMYDYLLERNADVNIGNDLEYENALMAIISNYYFSDEHQVSREQFITMVKKLIHDGIDINNIVNYGNVLTITARNNDFELMEILLKNGASLNNYVPAQKMNTFDYICTFGTPEMIELINTYYKQ